jgi:transglutaminase-like putative cysteine protease
MSAPKNAVASHVVDREPLHLMALHILCYWGAMVLFVSPMATWSGVAGALAGAATGIVLARRLAASKVRTLVVIGGCLAAAILGQTMDWLLAGRYAARLLGISAAVHLVDCATFFLFALAASLLLRILAAKAQVLRLVELACIVAPVVYLFAGHRDMKLGQPRFLTDWTLSHGYNPHTVLLVIGVVVIAAVAVLLLPRQTATKTAGVALAFALFCATCFGVLCMVLPEGDITSSLARGGDAGNSGGEGKPDDSDPSQGAQGQGGQGQSGGGQSGKGQNGQGQGGGKGAGSKGSESPPDDMPFVPNVDPPKTHPVGVVTLHDDYLPDDGMWHFRTAALSQFNGMRFVVATGAGFDGDVPGTFPAQETQLATAPASEETISQVPTTVGLIAKQSRPMCLVNPTAIAPVANPNPRLFTTCYRVTSNALRPGRERHADLAARAAGDPAWTPETRSHYLAAPDDPRYRELATKILAEGLDMSKLKPELQNSPYLKALAVRRWIEQNMIYSLRPNHDPNASPVTEFLFGNRKGYCVHVAHAMACLLRSVGIPARVATGFGVPLENMSTQTSITIQSTDGHAWCEIYLEGVGWTVMDAALEKKDPDTPQFPRPDAATSRHLAGQLRGKSDAAPGQKPEPATAGLPLLQMLAASLAVALVSPYAVKAWRRMAPLVMPGRFLYRYSLQAVLDRLAEVGLVRDSGETREEFARRVAPWTEHFALLTLAHERCASGVAAPAHYDWRSLETAANRQIRAAFTRRRRLLGLMNPFSWLVVS